jgi:hypothetical protein
MNLEKYGYSSITGVCFNPFGVKPREIQEAAAKLRHYILVDDTEEALFWTMTTNVGTQMQWIGKYRII